MAYEQRLKLIEQIENLRDSKVICYLTSTRANIGVRISEDAVRVFFDHLLLLPQKPVKRLDIFLCSNGGSGTVPWRLTSLFREYAEEVNVLLPYRAYSAATMIALGANEIVMHPFAEMGPIDPTVSNDFNPVDPQTQQRLGISVEDVKAYIGFVKDTVGIKHEDELVKTIEILANKVHPLALGNVERFISQSRMIARKILLTHMNDEASKHKIDEIVETLASKLYFHGHPINREEAYKELGLKIAQKVPPALETAMWNLYLDYEEALKNKDPFDPLAEIYRNVPVSQIQLPNGTSMNAIAPGTSFEIDLDLAYVECTRISSVYKTKRRYVVAGTGQMLEPLVREEALFNGWNQQSAQ